MDYQLMMAAASKGHMAHALLYKKLLYRIIKDPCPGIISGGVTTGCCGAGQTVPTTVHATAAGGPGSCSWTTPLTYDPVLAQWTGTGACMGPGTGPALVLLCGPGNSWLLNVGGTQYTASAGATCSPLLLVFVNVAWSLCGLACNSTATITITT